MNDATERDRDNRREYLYDMLTQLARMARDCGEHNVAHVLEALIVSRGVQKQGNGAHVEETSVAAN